MLYIFFVIKLHCGFFVEGAFKLLIMGSVLPNTPSATGSILTLHQQNLLVYGYIRTISERTNYLIPIELIKICAIYINNMQLFHWSPKLSQSVDSYQSPSFYINSAEFRLELQRDEVGYRVAMICVTVPSTEQVKDIILYYELYCRQTDRCYKKTKGCNITGEIDTWYAAYHAHESSSKWQALEITNIVDVLQMKYKEESKNFVKEVQMERELQYEWLINDKQISQLRLCPKGTKLFSPNIDNNCWCLFMRQSENECVVFGLQLLKHYPSVSKVNVDVVFHLVGNGIDVTWEGKFGPLNYVNARYQSSDRSYLDWSNHANVDISKLDGVSSLRLILSLKIPSMY